MVAAVGAAAARVLPMLARVGSVAGSAGAAEGAAGAAGAAEGGLGTVLRGAGSKTMSGMNMAGAAQSLMPSHHRGSPQQEISQNQFVPPPDTGYNDMVKNF